ncbi:hypothetical protein EDC04DRAFT_1617171 [Pisolithus marmoratus]|nr:hypothetical protein EDC04DRAFT_1617171 [Pisolithus marmoratus]
MHNLARIQMHLITKNTELLPLRPRPTPTRTLLPPTSSPPRPPPPLTRPTTPPPPTRPRHTPTRPAQPTPLHPLTALTSTAHPHLPIHPRPHPPPPPHSLSTLTPRLTTSPPTRSKTPGPYSHTHPPTHATHAHPSLSRSLGSAIHTLTPTCGPQTSFDNHMRRILHLQLQTPAKHIPLTPERTPNTTPVQYTPTTTSTHLVQVQRTHRLSPLPHPAHLTSQRHLRDTHIPKIRVPHPILQKVARLQEQVRTKTLAHRPYTVAEQGRPSYIPSEAQRPGPAYAPPEQQRTAPYGAGEQQRTPYADVRAPTYAPSPSTTAGTSTSSGRPAYVPDPAPVAITAPPPTAGPPARPPVVSHATMHYPSSHTLTYAVAPSGGESHDAGRTTGMPPPATGPPAHGHAHSHAYGPPQVPGTHPSHSSVPPPHHPHTHPQTHSHLQPSVSGPANPPSAHSSGSQPPLQQQQQQPPAPQVPPPTMHPHPPPHPQPQPTVPLVEPPRPAYVSPADTMHSRATRYVHGHGHTIGSHVPPSGSTHAGQVADQGLASPQGQAQAYAPVAKL